MIKLLRMAALIVLTAGCPAMAQTNTNISTTIKTNASAARAMNPGEFILANIERERAQIKAKGDAALKKLQDGQTLLRLRHSAGKISGAEYSRANTALRKQFDAEAAPGGKRLPELELREYETRKAYNIPKKESAKQHGYGNR